MNHPKPFVREGGTGPRIICIHSNASTSSQWRGSLFSLIDAESSPPNDADGIRTVVGMASSALDRGDQDGAAEAVIDYWMGPGSWANTPESRKQAIASSVRNVRRWAHALITEPTPLAAFRQLDIPILHMVGGRSTASAQGVARVLLAALPQAQVVRFEDLATWARLRIRRWSMRLSNSSSGGASPLGQRGPRSYPRKVLALNEIHCNNRWPS